jgi:hypothetical protein
MRAQPAPSIHSILKSSTQQNTIAMLLTKVGDSALFRIATVTLTGKVPVLAVTTRGKYGVQSYP